MDIADILMDTLPAAEIEDEDSEPPLLQHHVPSKFGPPQGFVDEEVTTISRPDKRKLLIKFLVPAFSTHIVV